MSPYSMYTILTIDENCIMKVKFSFRNSTIFSKYLRLKVHIANPDSNLVALIECVECPLLLKVFYYIYSVRKIETELERIRWLPRKQRMTVLVPIMGSLQNRHRRFAPREVLGLCGWSRASSRCGKSKRGSKGVGGCRENREWLCSSPSWANFLGNFQLALQIQIPFELRFLIRLWLRRPKLTRYSQSFCRAIQGC